jgi:S1-C subfamily serine protease
MRVLRVVAVAVLAAIVAAGVSTLYYMTRPSGGQPVGRGPLPQVGNQDGPQNAASKAAASVVRIETGPAPTPTPAQALTSTPGGTLAATTGGSGVIVDSRGYVLTAQSLVAGASRIAVAVPGQRTAEARVVGSDPLTGITVLKLDGAGFKALSLGNGSTLETGSGIVVMAAPPAFQLAVGAVATAHASTGIDNPAAPGRTLVLNDVSALDVAPRDGQLGAPLLDGAGRVVGIAVAAGSQVWAADIADAQPSISQLEDTGKVSYPSLNFDYRQLTVSEAADRGVGAGLLVLKVAPGSAAEKAGLAAGDIVTSVAGQQLDPGHPLERQLRGLSVHQTVTVVVHPAAGGTDKNLSLTVDLVSP